MSPWSTLLESLHSALVDELTDRHPEPKPELGMPIRKPAFELPEAGLTSSVCVGVDFGGAPSGCVSLCLCANASQALKLEATQLWEAMSQRATTEFGHRNIQPRLGPPIGIKPGDGLPPGFNPPQRMVWIPFRIAGGVIYLGMGV
jgi:hypothetical protein